MSTRSIVIKIGGAPASDDSALRSLAAEVRELSAREAVETREIAIVHGGGADVSALSHRLDIEPRFSDGIRMTSDAEMDVVDMVLCGLVNKRLVRTLYSCGVPSVGISGSDGALLTGSPISDADGKPSRTAHVSVVNVDLISRLWAGGYVPVIASPAADETGAAVNINADEAALAVGSAVAASAIVFLSDVRGVRGADGRMIDALAIGEAADLVDRKIVTDGMVAKLRSAAGAIVAGVDHIVIGSYEQPGDLGRLVSGRLGTTIHGD